MNTTTDRTIFYTKHQVESFITSGKYKELFTPLRDVQIKPTIINTREKLLGLLNKLNNLKPTQFVAWDWETTGLDPHSGEVVGLGCCLSEDPLNGCAYIPLGHLANSIVAVEPNRRFLESMISCKQLGNIIGTDKDTEKISPSEYYCGEGYLDVVWDVFIQRSVLYDETCVPKKDTKKAYKEAAKAYEKSLGFIDENRDAEIGYLAYRVATGNKIILTCNCKPGYPCHTAPLAKEIARVALEYLENGEVENEQTKSTENLPLWIFIEIMSSYFASDKHLKVFHNAKFDLQWFWALDMEVGGFIFDSLVGSYVLKHDRYSESSGRITHSLKALSKDLLGLNHPEYPGSCSDKPIDEIGGYCAFDCYATYKLCLLLLGELALPNNAKLLGIYMHVEHGLIYLLAKTEYEGLTVDTKWIEEIKAKKLDELKVLEAIVKLATKPDLNIGSTVQLNKYLFQDLQLEPHPLMPRGKSGLISLDKKYFPNFVAMHKDRYFWLERILQYRSLKHDLNTKLGGIEKNINPVTGRLHPSFIQAGGEVETERGTDTGRLSSKRPNVQNLPTWAKGWLVARPGKVFVEFDYSGFELRILLHATQDPQLESAITYKFPDTDKADPHRYVAQLLFEKQLSPADKDFKKLRKIAKTINFGIIYGMGGHKLYDMLVLDGMSVNLKQCIGYIQRYSQALPVVTEFMQSCHLLAVEQGYLETLLGRRRYFKFSSSDWESKTVTTLLDHYKDPLNETSEKREIYDTIMELVKPTLFETENFRQAGNFILQGSNADYNKLAEIEIRNYLYKLGIECSTYCRVHDALGFEVPEYASNFVQSIVKTIAESIPKLKYPTPVEVSTGYRWSEM